MTHTSVYITIDTECVEERLARGILRPPLGYDVMVWGRFANRRRTLGLELILAALKDFDFQATFFVEALAAEVFGADGLAAVCTMLRDQRQDIQLHLHPNLRRPEWRRAGLAPLPDNIGKYTFADQVALLEAGLGHLT
ncbi:MAG: polysaccharide deacetylase family protein, partial [Gemmatimonadales bacterium]